MMERTQPIESRMCPIKQNTPYQWSYWCITDKCSWWVSGAKMCAIELIGRQAEREITNETPRD